MSTPIKYNKPVSVPELRIQRGAQDRYNGLTNKYIASAIFDTADTDSDGVSNKTAAAHGLGVYIPDNAVITDAWIDVITTFTSATSDTATIAIKVQAANDLVSAVTIAAAGDVWNAGIHGTLVNDPALGADAAHDTALEVIALYAATKIKMTAERELTATVGVEALTAGKLVLFVEYVLSE